MRTERSGLSLFLAMLCFCLIGIIVSMHSKPVHAQAAGALQPFTVAPPSTQTHTACPPVTASTTFICFAFDGVWESLNGAAYVQLGTGSGTPTAAVLTINGVAPAANGDITLSATSTAPAVTASAMAPAVAATSTAPAVTITATPK